MRQAYKVIDVDIKIEELLLTGMVVSEQFMNRMTGRVVLSYFRTPMYQTIAKWALDYYAAHTQVPGAFIFDIFEVETRHQVIADKDRIYTVIEKMMEHVDNNTFNAEYAFSKGIDYFRRRSLELMVTDVNYFLSKDKLEEAEDALVTKKQVNGTFLTGMNPMSKTAVMDWWYASADELFRFPGELGRYLAPIQRGKLIGLLGPPKRGKSASLIEFFVQAAMHRLKAVYYSLEMTQGECNYRVAQRFFKFVREDDSKAREYLYPVLDCEHNQRNECVRAERTSACGVYDEEGTAIPYSPAMEATYQACTACRETPYHDTFQSVMWYKTETHVSPDLDWVSKKIDEFHLTFGSDNIYVESFPIKTFSIPDLEKHLEMLEVERGFIPDIIIVDYADIMKPPKIEEKRHQLGDLWENLSRVAKTRNALVVTASQGNRGSTNKSDLDMADLAEDFSKAMVVDILIGLNQSKLEKARNQIRWAILNHRYRGFDPHKQCMLYQCRELGQFCLDSEIFYKKEKEGRKAS